MKVVIAYDGGEAGDRALAAISNWASTTQPEIHLITILLPGEIHETSYGHNVHALTPAGTASGPIITVNEPLPAIAENRSQAVTGTLAEAEERLHDVAAKHLNGLNVQVHADINDHVAEAIIQTAEKFHADLIAVGTHGRTGLNHALMGSVAERVIRQSPIPVLVVGPHVAGVQGG